MTDERDASGDWEDNEIEAPEPEDAVDEALDRIEKLEKENREYIDRLKRLQADFENYKKRAARAQQEFMSIATERLVLNLLNLLDDFERAIANSENCENDQARHQGTEMIYKQLRDILRKEGVSEIPTGGKMDPFLHEVMTRVRAPDRDDGEIVEILQKGYKLGNKVIRPARVVVCRNEEEPAPEEKINMDEDDSDQRDEEQE